MTDEELKNLIASLAILHKESQIEFKQELKESRAEFDERLKKSQAEFEKRFENELKESRTEFDERLKKSQAEFEKSKREINKQFKELGSQIGGLANKFGSFTEGLALPSMTKILQQKFGMTVIAPRIRARKNGKSLELDILAYSNGDKKAVYVVEVKSHVREESLQQLLDILKDFPRFFPDHADKKLYGILAAVDISDNMKTKVLESGIYLANIQDEHFKLQVPKHFKAKNFQANSIH